METIRLARKDDIEEISKLWVQMAVEARTESNPDVGVWKQIINSFMDLPTYYLFVSEKNNEIVGFIDGMIFADPLIGRTNGLGQHFYIKPEHRGSDVSKKLYGKIIEVAKSNGLKSIELFCFPEMKTFWEHHGFRESKLIMKKDI